MALPAMAHDFEYPYEGQTLTYTVLDENAKTVTTRCGSWDTGAGNDVSGDLVLPSEVYDGDTKYTLTEIGDYAFYACQGMTSVTIPTSVTLIGAYAFEGCSGLTSITIPESVTAFGRDAFARCYGIKTCYIEGATAFIWIFDWLGSKTDIEYYLNGERLDFNSDDSCYYADNGKTLFFVNKENPDKVVIPESVTLIKSRAFSNVGQVKELSIPSTIEEIESDAFEGCNINRVDFADFTNWYNNVKIGNLKSCPYYETDKVYAGGIKVSAP